MQFLKLVKHYLSFVPKQSDSSLDIVYSWFTTASEWLITSPCCSDAGKPFLCGWHFITWTPLQTLSLQIKRDNVDICSFLPTFVPCCVRSHPGVKMNRGSVIVASCPWSGNSGSKNSKPETSKLMLVLTSHIISSYLRSGWLGGA